MGHFIKSLCTQQPNRKVANTQKHVKTVFIDRGTIEIAATINYDLIKQT